MATTTTPPGGDGTTPPGGDGTTPPGGDGTTPSEGGSAPSVAGAPRRTVVTPIRRRPLSGFRPLRFYNTAVGKKWVMGVTGLMLMGFVLAHLIGNLKLYLSKEEINLYGEALRNMPGPLLPRTVLLWGLRIGLIFAFVFHIHSAAGLTLINRRARPPADRYQSKRDYVAADYASRTMRWTGVIVLLFLVFHLMDLTWGNANGSRFLRGDPYNNLIYSMRRVPVAIVYILANIALAMHLYHGAWSMFQSMGITNPRYNPARRRFAQGFAAIILVGNCSFPIAVQLHAVTPQCPGQAPTTEVCNP
jgi:succinate dehydrogenase / fumarate reductase cytochrome b subunit